MNDVKVDNKAEHILQQQIEQLPKEMEPRRDLWAGIDHAIENGHQSNGKQSVQRYAKVAAGFAVFGWLSWLTLNIGDSAFEPQINNPSDSSMSADESAMVAQHNEQNLDFVTVMSQSFEEQKQALLVQFDGQQSMVVDWHKQLDDLDSAATVIKKALESDPSNAQLIKMLQQIYQQQLDLIKMVNRSPWQQI